MKKVLSFLILMLIVSVSFAQLGGGYSKSQADTKFATKAQVTQLDTTTLKVSDGIPATNYFMPTDTAQSKLDKKANLYHPALVSPTANTLPVGTNTTGLATTAGVIAEIADSRKSTLIDDMLDMGYSVITIPMYSSVFGNANSVMTDNRETFIVLKRIYKTTTCHGFHFVLSTSGDYTADNYNGIGISSISGTTTTLLSSTVDDGTIWKGTANTVRTKDLPTPITLTPGIYIISFVYNSSAQVTAPSINVFGTTWTSSALVGQTFKVSSYKNSNTLSTGVDLANTGTATTSSSLWGIWIY